MLDCECKIHIEGDTTMRNSGWQAMGGADTDGVQRYSMIGFDGATVHGWVQAVRPGEDPVIGYASENLDDLTQELQGAVGSHQGDGADVGIWPMKALKKLKKLARKVGITKVLKKASKLADYALSNPLVQGALAATGPMGASVLAAHQGYRMLKKYAKGNPKAMRFVKGVVRAAQRGNPKAIKMQRMLRMGQRAFGPNALRRYAVRKKGSAPRYGRPRFSSRYQPLCPRGRVSGDLEAIAAADVVELGKWIAGGGAGAAYMGDWEISGDHQFVAGDDAELGRWFAGGGAGAAYMGDWEVISGEDSTDEDIADLTEFAASAGVDIGAWSPRFRSAVHRARRMLLPKVRLMFAQARKGSERAKQYLKTRGYLYGYDVKHQMNRPQWIRHTLGTARRITGRRGAAAGDWEISGEHDFIAGGGVIRDIVGADDAGHQFVAGDDAELGKWMGGAGIAYMGDWEISGDHQGHAPGEVIVGAAEDAETDQDIADLNEFAASAGAWEGIAMLGDDLGAFEGLAWAADRLGPHSMAARPNELTARDALLDGRQGQAARFAM